MVCEKIKEIIPAYVKHTAIEEDIIKVEEHLCVCNECREFLGRFMDKPSIIPQEKIEEKPKPILPDIPQPKKTYLVEYLILGVAVIILAFFIFLLMKG